MLTIWEIEKFIIRQPPIGEKDDYDDKWERSHKRWALRLSFPARLYLLCSGRRRGRRAASRRRGARAACITAQRIRQVTYTCMHVNECMCICVMFIHIYVHMYMLCSSIYIYTYIFMFSYTHVPADHVQVHMRCVVRCVWMCVYACVYACVSL